MAFNLKLNLGVFNESVYRVTKDLKLVAGFQWSEIKYVLTLTAMLCAKYTRVFPSLPLRDLLTRVNGTFQAIEGGSGEICPTTT